MRGPNDALCEDEVDDEQQDDSRCDEDLGRDGYADVGGTSGPYDAHDTGDDAGHAETEHHG